MPNIAYLACLNKKEERNWYTKKNRYLMHRQWVDSEVYIIWYLYYVNDKQEMIRIKNFLFLFFFPQIKVFLQSNVLFLFILR